MMRAIFIKIQYGLRTVLVTLNRSHPVNPRHVEYSMDWIWTPEIGQIGNTS